MKNNLLEWRRYNEVRPFFDELMASGDLSTAHMSTFWQKTLEKRHNFPSFNDIITFRRGLASSIGYVFRISENTERRTFLRMFGRARALAPLEYLQANQESSIGDPYQFFKDGILSSSAGVDNVANAHRIETMLGEYRVAPDEHRILEIGAGYGGVAEVLIRRLNPAVYVVCDLPQNLFLSAFYLAANYPERRLVFVNDHPPEQIGANSLVFATPQGLEYIQEDFTLVVNTFSFQEMPMAEIKRYFSYIRDHLADDGLFYFFNHHIVADGAQKPGDYPFEQFAVRRWGPMPVTQQYIFRPKQAYEVIMRPNKGEVLPPYFDSVTETLSLLMFMGVNSHLEDMCERLVRAAISDEELAYLAILYQALTSRSARVGREMLEKLPALAPWRPVIGYISGLFRFFVK
jgi:putative sugar O-methyltransferase